jgi:hypothetical protein
MAKRKNSETRSEKLNTSEVDSWTPNLYQDPMSLLRFLPGSSPKKNKPSSMKGFRPFLSRTSMAPCSSARSVTRLTSKAMTIAIFCQMWVSLRWQTAWGLINAE